MTEILTLETAEAVVEVVPRLGGSLAAFDLRVGGERIPILRRWTGGDENPRALASSPIVPWFNRISGGGFSFAGKFHPIAPNDPLDRHPLHGDGWSSPWDIVERDGAGIRLRLRSRAIPPFDYEATQSIALDGATLHLTLAVTHLGPEPLPYGLAQHPWFVRTPETLLWAPATGFWPEQPPAFPATARAHPIPEKWDFSHPRHLPDGLTDNGFAGWRGRARIEWPDRGATVEVSADPGVRFYQIFSPGADSPFFCFEPVTHPNNALAMAAPPEETGLRILAPGEKTSMRVTLAARRL